MNGRFSSHRAREEAESIMNSIKNHSGIQRTRSQCLIIWLIIIIMIALAILCTIIAASIGNETKMVNGREQNSPKPLTTVFIILAFVVLIIGGIVLYCYCKHRASSYGTKKSGIGRVEKYMEKNGPDFEKRMDRHGYSIDWEFIEKGIGYTRKSGGRRRDQCRYYPSGWVFFFNTKGRNYSDRIKNHNNVMQQQMHIVNLQQQ